MNRITKCLCALLPLLLIVVCSFAAPQKRIPKWLPAEGNWMIETNRNLPLHSVIYFYTNEGVVVYKETIQGIRLNLEKKSVKMRLKKVLAEALVAWRQNKQLLEEQEWVACLFKKLD